MTDQEKQNLAREAIKNTNWEELWKKVDAAVCKECEALREARRKSMEEMSKIILR